MKGKMLVKQTMAAYEPPRECLDCRMRSVCRSCAAERTSGVLNGPVNRDVCERYARYIETGVLSSVRASECEIK